MKRAEHYFVTALISLSLIGVGWIFSKDHAVKVKH